MPTQPAPLPPNGPNMGLIVGLGVAVPVALVTTLLLVAHHNAGGRGDTILFDDGWQFQMVLENPLSLDAGRISAAVIPPQ